MTLATQAAAAKDLAFLDIVTQAIVTAAVNIASEPIGMPNHGNRVRLAQQVLISPGGYAAAFAQGVASQGLDKTSADAAISNAVSAIWNGYAGVM